MVGKTCSQCGAWHPLTYYCKESRRPGGLRSDCKSCTAKRNAKNYNRETDGVRKKVWVAANREHVNAKLRESRASNREHVNALARERYRARKAKLGMQGEF